MSFLPLVFEHRQPLDDGTFQRVFCALWGLPTRLSRTKCLCHCFRNAIMGKLRSRLRVKRGGLALINPAARDVRSTPACRPKGCKRGGLISATPTWAEVP